jgi:uncharacterized membrane protein YkoI
MQDVHLKVWRKKVKRQSYPPPKKQPGRRGGCLVYLLLLVFLTGLALWYFYGTERKAADAAPAIVAFTGESGILVKPVERKESQFGAIKTYSAQLSDGAPVTFDVDESTGQVVGFFRSGQTSHETRIDQQQALQIAIEFGTTRYQDAGIFSSAPAQARLVTGGDSNYYYFNWVKADPSTGAFLPQAVKIQVNAQTGQVDSYYTVFQHVTISLNPQITRESAEQIALNAMTNLPGAQIRESLLTVSTVPIHEANGQQSLIWVVTLQGASDNGYDLGVVVYIDAMTGTILLVEPLA